MRKSFKTSHKEGFVPTILTKTDRILFSFQKNPILTKKRVSNILRDVFVFLGLFQFVLLSASPLTVHGSSAFLRFLFMILVNPICENSKIKFVGSVADACVLFIVLMFSVMQCFSIVKLKGFSRRLFLDLSLIMSTILFIPILCVFRQMLEIDPRRNHFMAFEDIHSQTALSFGPIGLILFSISFFAIIFFVGYFRMILYYSPYSLFHSPSSHVFLGNLQIVKVIGVLWGIHINSNPVVFSMGMLLLNLSALLFLLGTIWFYNKLTLFVVVSLMSLGFGLNLTDLLYSFTGKCRYYIIPIGLAFFHFVFLIRYAFMFSTCCNDINKILFANKFWSEVILFHHLPFKLKKSHLQKRRKKGKYQHIPNSELLLVDEFFYYHKKNDLVEMRFTKKRIITYLSRLCVNLNVTLELRHKIHFIVNWRCESSPQSENKPKLRRFFSMIYSLFSARSKSGRLSVFLPSMDGSPDSDKESNKKERRLFFQSSNEKQYKELSRMCDECIQMNRRMFGLAHLGRLEYSEFFEIIEKIGQREEVISFILRGFENSFGNLFELAKRIDPSESDDYTNLLRKISDYRILTGISMIQQKRDERIIPSYLSPDNDIKIRNPRVNAVVDNADNPTLYNTEIIEIDEEKDIRDVEEESENEEEEEEEGSDLESYKLGDDSKIPESVENGDECSLSEEEGREDAPEEEEGGQKMWERSNVGMDEEEMRNLQFHESKRRVIDGRREGLVLLFRGVTCFYMIWGIILILSYVVIVTIFDLRFLRNMDVRLNDRKLTKLYDLSKEIREIQVIHYIKDQKGEDFEKRRRFLLDTDHHLEEIETICDDLKKTSEDFFLMEHEGNNFCDSEECKQFGLTSSMPLEQLVDFYASSCIIIFEHLSQVSSSSPPSSNSTENYEFEYVDSLLEFLVKKTPEIMDFLFESLHRDCECSNCTFLKIFLFGSIGICVLTFLVFGVCYILLLSSIEKSHRKLYFLVRFYLPREVTYRIFGKVFEGSDEELRELEKEDRTDFYLRSRSAFASVTDCRINSFVKPCVCSSILFFFLSICVVIITYFSYSQVSDSIRELYQTERIFPAFGSVVHYSIELSIYDLLKEGAGEEDNHYHDENNLLTLKTYYDEVETLRDGLIERTIHFNERYREIVQLNMVNKLFVKLLRTPICIDHDDNHDYEEETEAANSFQKREQWIYRKCKNLAEKKDDLIEMIGYLLFYSDPVNRKKYEAGKGKRKKTRREYRDSLIFNSTSPLWYFSYFEGLGISKDWMDFGRINEGGREIASERIEVMRIFISLVVIVLLSFHVSTTLCAFRYPSRIGKRFKRVRKLFLLVSKRESEEYLINKIISSSLASSSSDLDNYSSFCRCLKKQSFGDSVVIDDSGGRVLKEVHLRQKKNLIGMFDDFDEYAIIIFSKESLQVVYFNTTARKNFKVLGVKCKHAENSSGFVRNDDDPLGTYQESDCVLGDIFFEESLGMIRKFLGNNIINQHTQSKKENNNNEKKDEEEEEEEEEEVGELHNRKIRSSDGKGGEEMKNTCSSGNNKNERSFSECIKMRTGVYFHVSLSEMFDGVCILILKDVEFQKRQRLLLEGERNISNHLLKNIFPKKITILMKQNRAEEMENENIEGAEERHLVFNSSARAPLSPRKRPKTFDCMDFGDAKSFEDILKMKEKRRGKNRRFSLISSVLNNTNSGTETSHFLKTTNETPFLRKSITISHSECSCIFSDIVGFSTHCSSRDPELIVRMLNGLIGRIDEVSPKYNVEKIKTIGNCWMGCCGIPDFIPNHPVLTFQFSLEVFRCVKEVNLEYGTSFQIRCGINTGPAVSGVIGNIRYQYDIFGDSINLAARMEQTGIPDCVQVSRQTYTYLHHLPYKFRERNVKVKGKGWLRTYLYSPFSTRRRNYLSTTQKYRTRQKKGIEDLGLKMDLKDFFGSEKKHNSKEMKERNRRNETTQMNRRRKMTRNSSMIPHLKKSLRNINTSNQKWKSSSFRCKDLKTQSSPSEKCRHHSNPSLFETTQDDFELNDESDGRSVGPKSRIYDTSPTSTASCVSPFSLGSPFTPKTPEKDSLLRKLMRFPITSHEKAIGLGEKYEFLLLRDINASSKKKKSFYYSLKEQIEKVVELKIGSNTPKGSKFYKRTYKSYESCVLNQNICVCREKRQKTVFGFITFKRKTKVRKGFYLLKEVVGIDIDVEDFMIHSFFDFLKNIGKFYGSSSSHEEEEEDEEEELMVKGIISLIIKDEIHIGDSPLTCLMRNGFEVVELENDETKICFVKEF